MNYIFLLWLSILTYIVWKSNKLTIQKIKALLQGHSALWWALKSKNVINIEDWKEGQKIAKGEKMGDMSLKDFIDLDKK